MTPTTLYNLSPYDFMQMVNGHISQENYEYDCEMKQLAWQTSIIANSIGRLKKPLKPTDLYKSMFDDPVTVVGKKEETKESLEQKKEQLKSAFGI